MLKKCCYRQVPENSEKKINWKLFVVLSLGFILLASFSFTQIVFSDGFNFDGIINLSKTPSGDSIFPQIATSNSNVYVIWQDDEFGDPDIFFIRSNDDGVTFPFAIDNLSSSSGFSDLPQIAATDENVYVIWQDDPPPDFFNDIYFTASTNSGASFGSVTKLSSSSGFSDSAQIAASGDNVYVVWQDLILLETFYSKSNDAGATFSGGINPLSDDDSLASVSPQVAAAGNNVYLVWLDNSPGNDAVFFTASTDSGASFGNVINLNSGPNISQSAKIAAAGNNVYVSWQEKNPISGFDDIFFRASVDGGTTFGNVINLSNSNGFSLSPQIATIENNVVVVWYDDVAGINNIFFAGSTNNGLSFDSLSSFPTANDSTEPQISVGSVHIIWEESTAPNEIFYNRGIESITLIEFDSLQYKLSDTATVTVTDASSNAEPTVAEEILVTVISDTDGVGVSLTLTETDVDTGIFSGNVTFTPDTSSESVLQASPGDIITASFEAINANANIFPREIKFDLPFYTLSNLAKVTVEDQNSNIDPLVNEIITVDITSDTDPVGITLDLEETGPNDGIFKNKNLIFMTGSALFSLSDTITITQEEPDFGFKSDDMVNTITVSVISTSDTVGIPALKLTETGPNTGLFEGTLSFTSGSTTENAIHVVEGDILSVEYRDEIARGLIIPNPDRTVGAVEAAIGDIVTASYLGASDNSDIEKGSGGGGGGGLIRPGLVLNIILGLFGTSGPDRQAPSVSSSSLILLGSGEDGFGGIISETNLDEESSTKIVKVGEKLTLRFEVFENRGSGYVHHIALYLNGKGHYNLLDGNTYIRYDKFKGLEIQDQYGIFAEVFFEILEIDLNNFVIKIDIIFAKPMETSDLLLRMWDYARNQQDLQFVDAIYVTEDTLPVPTAKNSDQSKTYENSKIKSTTVLNPKFENTQSSFELEQTETITNSYDIPIWVKNNARWWSLEEIDDYDFVAGVKYLIKQKIILIENNQITTDNLQTLQIPNWFKINAGWWANKMITDADFVQGAQWLIKKGVMNV